MGEMGGEIVRGDGRGDCEGRCEGRCDVRMANMAMP